MLKEIVKTSYNIARTGWEKQGQKQHHKPVDFHDKKKVLYQAQDIPGTPTYDTFPVTNPIQI
jgi:hypothetical protein